jgi:hypothetical protein
VCHASNGGYARDALFSYKRGPKEEVGSGAHLDTDEVFLAGGGDAKVGNVIALKPV